MWNIWGLFLYKVIVTIIVEIGLMKNYPTILDGIALIKRNYNKFTEYNYNNSISSMLSSFIIKYYNH